jgi:prephenate dehydratase
LPDTLHERAVSERMSIAIQGELGSNSHMAAQEMLGDVVVVPCSVSAEVVDAVLSGRVDAAVLPIENSLHGSVAEHYDLLLEHPLRIDRESLLRIRHHLLAAPGVMLEDIRHVLSHPVALSQCRRFLATFQQADAMPFYDTAGSVKYLMEEGAAVWRPDLGLRYRRPPAELHAVSSSPQKFGTAHRGS